MKYLSLFSGIGGFELGIQKAYENYKCRECQQTSDKSSRDGLQRQGDIHDNKCRHARVQHGVCIGYSEIDKYAIQIYNKHFNHKNYGDITKIDTRTLPEFDLLCGGFPCQSFSIAGKRGGFNDTRGTLFFEIARIIRKKQPRLLLLENVKGLLSHDKGNTFYTIISTLDELGYDCQWQVLNSKNHGVPQNRERVFIIGHLRGTSRPEVFPIGGTNTEIKGNTEINQLNNPIYSNDRDYKTDGISPTLNTMQGGNRQPFIVGGLQGHQTAREDGISPCLTTSMGSGGGQTPVLWSDDTKIRRLTPTECERLQGFPDGWTTEGNSGKLVHIDSDGFEHYEDVKISDTQRYKTLGNAVTVNVIQSIMEKLL